MEIVHGNLANDTCGWASQFSTISGASLEEVVNSLAEYVRDATPEQIRAWKSSIPPIQNECAKILKNQPTAVYYGAILEYRMPDGPHRVDAILLLSGAVLVLELKGDGNWQPGYIEQASDYARRLYWYHSLCGEENVRVHTILVSYGQKGDEFFGEWHTRTNIERLVDVVRRFDRPNEASPIPLAKFISQELCEPSPSLVQAARRFFAELDHTLLVWGGDFVLKNEDWDSSAAKKYLKKSAVKDPLQLRRNAYRVLLTRGREGVLICLPATLKELDETYTFLVDAGCEVLAET